MSKTICKVKLVYNDILGTQKSGHHLEFVLNTGLVAVSSLDHIF
jgi:hypothetical protein